VALDVLAIAAHPDDVEITCGGLMIKLADAGKATGVLDLTRGESGTFGTPTDRLAEAEDAATIMGLKMRENLALPDSALEDKLEYKQQIATIIRKYKPHMIILPYPDQQRHPDHRYASQLGYDSCYLAGLKKTELKGEPHRPHKIIYSVSHLRITPSFYVDITEQYDRKIKAVAAYQTQFGDPEKAKVIYRPGQNIFKLLEIYHRHYGMEAGCRFAETYYIKEPLMVDDPTDLRVRSI